MGSGHAGKGMGNQSTTGHQGVEANDPALPDDSDMTQQVQGNNQLAGNDQVRAHNERRGVPGETTRTQGVIESFELLDPVRRAAQMNENKKSGKDRFRPAEMKSGSSAALRGTEGKHGNGVQNLTLKPTRRP